MAEQNPSKPDSASRGYRIRAVLSDTAPTLPGSSLTLSSARRVQVDTASRGSTAAQALEVRNDELVRVVFDDQHHLWLRADELKALRGSASDSRGAGDDDMIDLDLDTGESTQRGALSIGIKVLEFFGVDLKATTAGLLAGTVDKKRLLMGEEKIYRCHLDKPDAPLSPAPAVLGAAGEPLLIFIHGTFSNFVAGYQGLMAEPVDDAGRAAAALRQSLFERYRDRIYAFEHQTLGRSPIANAMNLVKDLPEGAELHLVTHSRGGLIGELLALSGRVREGDRLDSLIGALFEAQDVQRLRPPNLPELKGTDAQRLAAEYRQQAQDLRALVALMDRKGIRVRRFVRVACPARGTTLASARLDRWLGVLQTVMPDSFVGDALDFLLAVLKERTDARVMPGIEAMMPGSALTRLLNAGITTEADLSVIAGDTQGAGFFSRLKAFVADWFYGSDNDLVVNTGSMAGGLTRTPGQARALEDRGTGVTHTRYFVNPVSLAWLASGLMRPDGAAGGYADIARARQEAPRARGAKALAVSATDPRKRPIVVLVPGAMGTTLHCKGKPVWLDFSALLLGGMKHLGIDAQDVTPSAPMEDFYGPLLEHLAREHHVQALAYDWRLSLTVNAQRLQEALKPLVARAEEQRVPLHLVAHSMGGLVTRLMIADTDGGQALWQRIGRLPGGPGRLLMLGTPNQGSHEAVRWFTGCNPTQAKLAFLDFTTSMQGLMKIVRRFPGLIELLPFGSDEVEARYAGPALWAQLRKHLGTDFPLVEPTDLAQAKAVWQRLRAAPIDPDRMLYVAGCDRATVIDQEIAWAADDFAPRLNWIASAEGDGTVSWASGQLPGLKVWYAPGTAHDELCCNEADRRIFRAYVDLLSTGRTDQLSMTPPARSRGARKTFTLLPPPADALPGEDDLRSLGLGRGIGHARHTAEVPARPTLSVSVRHGNLMVAARHPVVVGHYVGDLLVSAERALDGALNQALSQAVTLGVYPGPGGTSMSFFAGPPGHAGASRGVQGALVLGLGQVGDLSAARLRSWASAGMVDHARQRAQRQPGQQVRQGIGLSCLLVGSAGAGLSVRESVEALVRAALDANRKLEEAHLDSQVLIDQLEFVELLEDVAVAAGHALQELRSSGELAEAIRWEPAEVDISPRLGGRRRSVYDSDRGWDLRVEILENTETGQLSYSFAGQRARAEQQVSTGQVKLVESYIEQSIASTEANQDISKTLYEMLLPVDFRLAAPEARGLVLLLDERSARFPWELLEDRWSPNRQPLAVASGLVRQLKAMDYRPSPRMAQETAVLVVGDPQLKNWELFEQLPGAEQEAGRVRDLFESKLGASAVRALVGPAQASTRAITTALHERPWRVMHIAAHGVHEHVAKEGDTPLTGLIIGKEVFLQPGDAEQLRHVPELVFLNCCHLGRTDGAGNEAYNKLAANLAVAFIRMGARAVVAAGWEVDDEAGVTFAMTFYGALLEGSNFRDAVHIARQRTFQLHPSRNTWGAYQCYGEPGWKLMLNGERAGSPKPPAYVSPRELVVDLDNLRVDQLSGQFRGLPDDERRRQIQVRVKACLDRVPSGDAGPAWLRRGDVTGALGLLHVEAELNDEALEWLDKAVAATDDQAPLRALEQLANRQVRGVEREWRNFLSKPPAGRAAADARRQALVDDLAATTRFLQTLSGRSGKRETWCLLGSAHKRRALIADAAAQRQEALFEMARAYHAGWQCRDGDDDYYPVSNGTAAALLLDREQPGWASADERRRWREAVAAQLEALLTADQALLEQDHDTWRAIGQGDLAVSLMLARADVAAAARAAAQRALQKYRHALQRAGSERNVVSMRRHLDFLLSVMPKAAQPWPKAVLDDLAGVITGLEEPPAKVVG